MIFGQRIADDFPVRRSYTQTRGWTTTRTVRGVQEDIEGLIPDILAAGATDVSIDPEEGSPYATLSWTYGHLDDGAPPETQLVDLWTLRGNDLDIDLINHPKVQSVTRRMRDDKLSALRSAIDAALENYTAPASTPFAKATYFAGQPGLNPAVAAAIMTDFYREKLRGADNFSLSQWVLQRTVTLNPGTNFRPGIANVGRVYTTASLTSHWNIPGTIMFTLPAGEWLERTPTLEQLSNGKYQFQQEWWHAEAWSTFSYPRATT